MMRNLIFSFFLIIGCFGTSAQHLTAEEAIEYFTATYPKAQLSDLYKSFYQDNFGPGHLLGDTIAARKYFNTELNDSSVWGGPVYEFTGTGKNFVRLNMDLIRTGIIPANAYFNAFVNSLGQVVPPSDKDWVEEWKYVNNLLELKKINFPEEEADRALISEKMQTHNFTMHHSSNFNKNYNFHYRIISLPEFEKLKENYSF